MKNDAISYLTGLVGCHNIFEVSFACQDLWELFQVHIYYEREKLSRLQMGVNNS